MFEAINLQPPISTKHVTSVRRAHQTITQQQNKKKATGSRSLLLSTEEKGAEQNMNLI